MDGGECFQIGLSLFTLASILCSQARTIEQLTGFRAVQGLGASMLNPVALSIIANAFPERKERGRAVGIWGAVAGLSLGIGPLIGGLLTQTLGWRWIFWINLPIGITAIVLAALFVPESKAARARAFDPVGQVLVLVGLALLSLEATFHFRGVIQRVTEGIQFTGVFFVCYLLSRKMTP